MIKDMLITAAICAVVFWFVAVAYWMSYDVKVPPVAEICHDCIERNKIKAELVTELIKVTDDLADVQALLLLIVVDNPELIKKRRNKNEGLL